MPVPHQPPNNIPLASSLPKVSFRKIPAIESQQLHTPAGVQDQQHINFGFNDGSEFDKPEHYLRYVEPIESELNKQVEYDMDEQDQEWLDALNVERRRDQQDVISYEVFEIIIDRLEKEWFDLMKRIPVKSVPLAIGENGEPIADGSEDIECAICDDGECENSNAIVFCDGCNLAVHQDCYGIPYIPEGQWLCRKCTVSPDRAVSCVLCPHEGGAFKQTTQGKWAHLLCAMWIPETGVSNPVYMEPIDSIERVPKARWKLQCYLCKHKMGACIQCDNKNCFTAFHVTCARRNGLLLKSQRQRVSHSLDSDEEESTEVLRAWCHKHIPKSLRIQRAKLREQEEQDEVEEAFQDASSQLSSASPRNHRKDMSSQSANAMAQPGRKKSARAYKKSYRAGPSLVPVYVINRVLEHIARIHIRKKLQLTVQIAKFWSLKREARRGAPLLKRLHLEPWTASTNHNEQSDAERIKKLQFLLRLREDLEKVRMLAELVRKREKEKLRQVQVIRSTLVDGILFPYHNVLRKTLERISGLDRTSLFLHPVSPQKVPDYYDIIKHPMDWTTIAAKVDDYRYESVSEFIADVNLVLNNAMLYNKSDTLYHRTAARIKKLSEPIFEDIGRLDSIHGNESDLRLEAEDVLVKLLQDYPADEILPSADGSKNVMEELTRHFYVFDSPKVDDLIEVNGITKGGGQAVRKSKAAERAARSERSRLAAQRRKEAKEAQVEESINDIVHRDVGESSRNVKQSSTLKASMASLEARRRTAEGRASRAAGKRPSESNVEEEEEAAEDEEDVTKLEVEKVDDHLSFTKFNTGWVLPDGTKRRRTTLGSDPSTMTLSSENDRGGTKRETSSDLSEPEEEDEEEVGGGSFSTRRLGRSRIVTTAETHKRKRTLSSSTTIDEPNRRVLRGTDGQSSTIKEAITRPRHTYQGETKKEEQNRKRREARKLKQDEDNYPISTLCWAKWKGYPFHPAEIFDPTSKIVPKSVHEIRESVSSNDETIYLVRFFDSTSSFAWVPTSKLKLLFEDPEVDRKMLKADGKSHQRKEIKASYERAREQLEV